MIELLTDPHAWAALVTLTVLEIVLGIDNVLFISILVSRCDPKQAQRARQIGLSLAFIFRIVMLFGLTWLMKLTQPIFSIYGLGFSWRDVILIGGGMFLIAKATREIHNEVELRGHEAPAAVVSQSFFWVVMQLIAIDLVFSLDLDHHRDRHGPGYRGDDRGGWHRDDRDVCRVRSGLGIHHQEPDHQDARARLPGADRRGAGGRRLRGSHPARLYLFRHGVRRRGRRHQRGRRAATAAAPVRGQEPET